MVSLTQSTQGGRIMGIEFPSGKRYNSFTAHIKERFGGRIQKLSIDAGFTCPNRDGSLGTGGCSFCDNRAFNPSYCREKGDLKTQIEKGIRFHRKRYRGAEKYMVYFQAYSNTYDQPDNLEKLYKEALSHPSVVAISIGTRPDCLPEPVMEVLEGIHRRTFLNLEIGIESCYDKTLRAINRGHDFRSTQDAFQRAAKRGIFTTGHLILGLPGESREEILNEAALVSGLPVNNLKFHQLQIVKGTKMAEDYLKNPSAFADPSLRDYLELMIDFIERLSPDIYIDRIAGETVPQYNLRSSWGERYDGILRKFEEQLLQRDTWQGRLLTNQKL
jgi:hypothetical protein